MAILVLLSWRFSPSIPRPLLCLPVLWYSSKTLNIHTRIMCVCVVFKYACACVIYFILCIEWLICNINLFCADPFYCMLKNCCFLCVMFVYVWACRFCGVSHLKHEPFCAYTFWFGDCQTILFDDMDEGLEMFEIVHLPPQCLLMFDHIEFMKL